MCPHRHEVDAVIIAADTSVSRDRFEGKPLVKAKVAKAINEAEDLLREAAEKADGAVDHDESAEPTDTAAEAESEPTETKEQGTTSSEPSASDRSESGGLLGKLKSLFS